MKISKLELKQRILENLEANKRKRRLEEEVKRIILESDVEQLDEKSKDKKRKAKAKKAKAAKAKPAAAPEATDAPAADAPKPEGEAPAAGGLKSLAKGFLADPKAALKSLPDKVQQHLKDNPDQAKALEDAIKAGEEGGIEGLLGSVPGQDELMAVADKVASGEVSGLEAAGAAGEAALAGGYGVEAAQLAGGAAAKAVASFTDAAKNAETLAATVIPQLQGLGGFLKKGEDKNMASAGRDLESMAKMLDKRLGLVMSGAAEAAKGAGEAAPEGAAAEVPGELTDEQKADMSPEEVKAYEADRESKIAQAAKGGAAPGAEGAAGEGEDAKLMGAVDKYSDEDLEKMQSQAKKNKDQGLLSQVMAIKKRKAEKSKYDAAAGTLKMKEQSPWGKSKTAQLNKPDDYFWKKYGPMLGPDTQKVLMELAKNGNWGSSSKMFNNTALDDAKDVTRRRDPAGGLVHPKYWKSGGPNSAHFFNKAEAEEARELVKRIAKAMEGEDKKLLQTIKSSKLRNAWKKSNAEAKAAKGQTSFVYDKDGNQKEELTALETGDAPDWYKTPEGVPKAGAAEEAPPAAAAAKPPAKEPKK